MDLSAFYSQFRDETVENIRSLNKAALAIDREGVTPGERREHIDTMFRAMHTIKGSARILGFDQPAQIAHAFEHILSEVRDNKRTLTSAMIDRLLRAGDVLQELIQTLAEGNQPDIDVAEVLASLHIDDEPLLSGTPSSVDPSPPATPDAPSSSRSRSRLAPTVRVRVDQLDLLLNLAGELLVERQVHQTHISALEEMVLMCTQQQRALQALEGELRRMRFSAFEQAAIDRTLKQALMVGAASHIHIKQQLDHFIHHSTQTSQLVLDLEREVMMIRLQPLRSLFANLPRATRELGRVSGKEIDLVLVGEDTELDRKIIEAIHEPLIHLLRNAIDHGLESPEQRIKQGKPAFGRIEIKAQATGTHVHISISDDGAGMDTHKLRQAAVQQGLMSSEAAARLSETEALELIFLPGFSTAPTVTDISGRGVGMDIVRTNIIDLGGQVHIATIPNRGTTTTLVLPLTLVTSRVLVVREHEHTFALPVAGCQGCVWTDIANVHVIDHQPHIDYNTQSIPLFRLADLLELGSKPLLDNQRIPTIVVGTDKSSIALLVDQIVDELEVVVKPLGQLLEPLRQYSGSTQLGNGQLILLLNHVTLVQLARQTTTHLLIQSTALRRKSRIMVVDDSATIQRLYQSMLQAAGYIVTTANDGQEALEQLSTTAVDLLITDVEMPRMNGFELIKHLRTTLAANNLPIIIISSLARDDYMQQTLEVGAQAYIVKSAFHHLSFLETVQNLLDAGFLRVSTEPME